MGATVRAGFGLLVLISLGCTGSARPPGPAPAPTAVPAPAAEDDPPRVYFRTLMSFLPSRFGGFTASSEQGSTGRYGELSLSSAERTYQNAEGELLTLKLLDSNMVGKIAPAIVEVSQRIASEGNGSEQALLLPGSAGYARYDADERTAEANVLVAGRFILAVNSTGAQDTRSVQWAARAVDVAGLTRLR